MGIDELELLIEIAQALLREVPADVKERVLSEMRTQLNQLKEVRDA